MFVSPSPNQAPAQLNIVYEIKCKLKTLLDLVGTYLLYNILYLLDCNKRNIFMITVNYNISLYAIYSFFCLAHIYINLLLS